MALRIDFFCPQCQKEKQVSVPSGGVRPKICEECLADNKDGERDKFLKDLKELPLEERVAKLEEQLYDLKEVIPNMKMPKKF